MYNISYRFEEEYNRHVIELVDSNPTNARLTAEMVEKVKEIVIEQAQDDIATPMEIQTVHIDDSFPLASDTDDSSDRKAIEILDSSYINDTQDHGHKLQFIFTNQRNKALATETIMYISLAASQSIYDFQQNCARQDNLSEMIEHTSPKHANANNESFLIQEDTHNLTQDNDEAAENALLPLLDNEIDTINTTQIKNKPNNKRIWRMWLAGLFIALATFTASLIIAAIITNLAAIAAVPTAIIASCVVIAVTVLGIAAMILPKLISMLYKQANKNTVPPVVDELETTPYKQAIVRHNVILRPTLGRTTPYEQRKKSVLDSGDKNDVQEEYKHQRHYSSQCN